MVYPIEKIEWFTPFTPVRFEFFGVKFGEKIQFTVKNAIILAAIFFIQRIKIPHRNCFTNKCREPGSIAKEIYELIGSPVEGQVSIKQAIKDSKTSQVTIV